MRRIHLKHLVCPISKEELEIKSIEKEDETGRIEEGILIAPISAHEYPIKRSIPRFVPKENYADSFGFQWNRHYETQYDEHTGVSRSKTRFFEETKWGKQCSGDVMLEAGSGSGRFTRHALETGADVVSFDYSSAVEANYRQNGASDRLLLVQADIYNMPFRDNYFDKVFCFGVLQHTPDPEQSFTQLVRHLNPGGKLATDVYWKSFRCYLHIKYWVRPFVKNIRTETLYRGTKRYVDTVWPLSRLLRRNRLGQKAIGRIVADCSDVLPGADDKVLREWAYLNTFDWLSPAYDSPQTLSKFRRWHEKMGLINIDVHRGYNGLEGRAVKSK